MYKVPSDPLLTKRSVCLPVQGKNRKKKCHETNIFILLGTSFCPSARYLSINW